jgi:hypothetical protein
MGEDFSKSILSILAKWAKFIGPKIKDGRPVNDISTSLAQVRADFQFSWWWLCYPKNGSLRNGIYCFAAIGLNIDAQDQDERVSDTSWHRQIKVFWVRLRARAGYI